jgi:hypothetical protein
MGLRGHILRLPLRTPEPHGRPGGPDRPLGGERCGQVYLHAGARRLLPQYECPIQVDGAEARDRLPGYRRRVGLLLEKLIGTPSATVAERLDFLAAFHPSWDSTYAAELLSALELSASARIGTLSPVSPP